MDDKGTFPALQNLDPLASTRSTASNNNSYSQLFSEQNPVEVAAARAKEQEEQDALPYKWVQTIAELDVTFIVPGNMKSRDLVIEIKKQSLSAGIKGQDTIIKVNSPPPMPILA